MNLYVVTYNYSCLPEEFGEECQSEWKDRPNYVMANSFMNAVEKVNSSTSHFRHIRVEHIEMISEDCRVLL